MKRNIISVLVVMLLLTTALLGCGKSKEVTGNSKEVTGNSPQPTEAAKKESLSVGMAKFTTNAPLYIALEKGFFKDENLDVNFKFMDSSSAINTAVVSGSVEVGASGISADLYNMIAAGQKVVIVADKGKEEKGYFYSALMVPNDSPIKSIEDVKGKKIGVTTIGSTNHYNMGRVLEKHGVNTKDVQWVPLNGVSGLMEALKGKSLDIVVLSEPNASITVKQGYGKVLAWVSDEINPQSAAVFFSPKFAGNKDAGVRLLKAYVKGARYYYDAVLTQKDGKLAPGQNFDEVAKIVAKYTGQPEETVKGTFSYIDPNGKLNADDIKTQIDWYAKEKFLTKAIDTKDFLDTSLLEEALKLVGK